MSVRILRGDCLSVLATLPSESVNCVVTSPPYWGLRDYGVAGQLGLESTPSEYIDAMVEVFREVRRVLRSDGTLWLNIGDCYAGSGRGGNPTAESSTLEGSHDSQEASIVRRSRKDPRGSQVPAGFHETQRVAGAIGRAWVPPPAGLKQKDLIGIPWMLAFALRADGWWLRQDIIWAKRNCMPESMRDRCTKSHEYLFLLSKSERYYYDADAIAEPQEEAERTRRLLENQRGLEATYTLKRDVVHGQDAPGKTGCAKSLKARHDLAAKGTRNKRSVWFIGTQPFPEAHFATFPPALIEPCILAGCPRGGVTLDPFGGAGTTGLVADRLQRDAILIELNPEYADMAERRIRNESPLLAQVTA